MCIERTDLIGKQCLVTVRTVPAHVLNDWAGHRGRANWTAYESNNYTPTEDRQYEATIFKAAQQAEDKPIWLLLRSNRADIWSVAWLLSEVELIP